MKIENRNVFFCSDPHYNHKNLVDSTSEWSDKTRCRKFTSLEEHNRTLVKNINDTVKENDILFC